jgi:para-nitrobenzyl esterase
MKNCILTSIALSLIAILVSPAVAQVKAIEVTGGLVSGLPGKDPSIVTYKGIPFAAPPVGNLRWRAPQPVAPWPGVLKADKFSASCIQQIVPEFGPWTYEFMAHNDVSEDCLYLNVFTPAKSASEKHPVFVHIYGGGFVQGSSAVPIYDGEGLAKKGLVVVTFNYRVGALGFLAHPELTSESGHQASGNYGLMDQIAALRWVHENIARFGGDPNNVTIAGQSAGSMAVHDLTASPLARGLFHRAIAQSGGSTVGGIGINMEPTPLAAAEAEGLKFAEAKDAHSLAELRALSWQKILEPIPSSTPMSGLRFGPVVDGYVLPASFMQIIAQGKQNDVETLTGNTEGELGGLFASGAPITAKQFQDQARKRYGDKADEFLKLYPAATDEQAQIAQRESTRDQALVALYLWAKVRSKTAKTKVYEYLWDHPLPGPDAVKYGAFHSSEIPYVLNTLDNSNRPFTDADRKIANLMSSYWANFASTGNPNGSGLPVWPAISDKPEIMEVGDKTQPIPLAATPAKIEFFKSFLTQSK